MIRVKMGSMCSVLLISDCLWLRCAISGNEMDNLGGFS